MNTGYQRLEQALARLVGAEKPLKALLGYSIDGEYTVTVPDNAAKYYARFPDGSFAEVYHRGRASPVPDLPVEVGIDSAGNWVILGGDPDRAALFAGDYEVGLHSHARGSGMEFPIDPRLLTPVKAAPLGGLVVSVAQGAYADGASLRWWSGGTITLTPPGGANTWAWVVVGIDAAAGELVEVSGTAVAVSAPLDPSTIPTIGLSGAIPLAAVRLRSGQTELDEDDFEDLRFIVGVGGGAAPNGFPDFGAAAAVQISGGVLDISAASSRNIIVQAESGSADAVDQIIGLGDGEAAIFQADSGDVITFAHSSDIHLYNATDLDVSSMDLLMLVGRGAGVVAQPVDEKGTGGGGGGGSGIQPQSDLIFLHRFAKVSGSFSIPLTYTAGSSWMFGVTVNQNTPGNGDSMEVDVMLAAGAYTLSVVGFAFNNRGRLDWSIDGGSPFISAQEWYSASGNNNLIQTGSFTVADAGRHVLSFTVNGKHGSSSNYYFAISAVWITKSSYTVDT